MSAPPAPARVLHVFATFAPAGPQVRTVELLGGLGDGWRHTIVAGDGRIDAADLIPPGVHAEVRPGTRGLPPMRALLAAERPDLLCTYNWGAFDAVLAARLAGRRSHLHHEDGFNADEAARQKRRRVWARRLALGRAHRVVVPSRVLFAAARSEWRVPEERLALVVNGVRAERFRPDGPGRAEVRAELGIPPGALVVGSVGSLRPVKRFDRLLAACHRLGAPEGSGGVHVLLVGEGPERRALEERARAGPPPGGAVHFAGHRADLGPVYRAMDVFCLSSDSEQLPVSLLEAMASGLPVASTDVGDVRVTVPEEGRDLVVPLGSGAGAAERLAGALGALLADARRRAELGALGRRRARAEYSYEAMVAAYRRLYESAVRV